jgi:hypothetical protein
MTGKRKFYLALIGALLSAGIGVGALLKGVSYAEAIAGIAACVTAFCGGNAAEHFAASRKKPAPEKEGDG